MRTVCPANCVAPSAGYFGVFFLRYLPDFSRV